MHRTNVYLTAEQERALDALARVQGTTRSAVLREIIDEALPTASIPDESVRRALETIADGYTAASRELYDDDPDLRIS